eukprot:TRINITY_DN70838_c0_g1_i1.p1 TRINITY_DN70838_c0_g1~~TRINITY_DN70838_c0_g1_i1.p1  ORF type:complete len:246 (+),score=65.15 TRINITY_DN70838_c0_g1_i1:105-842(+)
MAVLAYAATGSTTATQSAIMPSWALACFWAGALLLILRAVASSMASRSAKGQDASQTATDAEGASDSAVSKRRRPAASEKAVAAKTKAAPEPKRKSRRQRQRMAFANAQMPLDAAGDEEVEQADEEVALTAQVEQAIIPTTSEKPGQEDESSASSTEPPSDGLSETSGDHDSSSEELSGVLERAVTFIDEAAMQNRCYNRCLLLAHRYAQRQQKNFTPSREVLQWPPGLVPSGLEWSPSACVTLP